MTGTRERCNACDNAIAAAPRIWRCPSKLLASIAALVALFATPALAQRTTGGISGTVKDSTGALLPGVTVAVSGPNIVGTQTATTNEQGFYRFINLPPGDYQLVFTLQGFTSVTHRGLRVPVGGTIESDAALAVRQVQESIDVVGESPVVDTTSNEVGMNFDREWVENAPLRRFSFFDLVASAPGSVQAGDGSARTHMYGSSYDENSFQVDGVDITDNYFNEALAEPNVDAIDEVEVLSLGAPAEYGNLTGAVYNIVTRQGTNEFHGDLNLFFQTDGLTSNNTEDTVNPDGSFLNACSDGVGRCPWKRDNYTDITAQLGGPIVKDKLWFFASYQNQRDYFWDAGFAYTDLLRTNERTDRYFFKLNWQIDPKHKLVGTFHYDEQNDDAGPASLGAAGTTAFTRRGTTPTPGLGYTGVLSEHTVVDVRYSGFYGSVNIGPTDPNQPRDLTHFIDNDTGAISGGHYYWYELEPKRNTVTAKVSHFADKFLGASHDFRFGVQYSDAEAPGIYGYNDLVYTYSLTDPTYGYGIARTPFSYNGSSRSVGVFVDDTIRLNERFTINAGVRWDYNKAYSPEQQELDENSNPTGTSFPETDYYTWKQFSPRFGFNWKATADGKTVLKGHWGRYHRAVATGEFANILGPNVKPYFAGGYDVPTGTFLDLVPDQQQRPARRGPELREPAHRPVHPVARPGDLARLRREPDLRQQARQALRGLGGDARHVRADPVHRRRRRGRHGPHVRHLRDHQRPGRPLLPDHEPRRAREQHQRRQPLDQPADARTAGSSAPRRPGCAPRARCRKAAAARASRARASASSSAAGCSSATTAATRTCSSTSTAGCAATSSGSSRPSSSGSSRSASWPRPTSPTGAARTSSGASGWARTSPASPPTTPTS